MFSAARTMPPDTRGQVSHDLSCGVSERLTNTSPGILKPVMPTAVADRQVAHSLGIRNWQLVIPVPRLS
jgi:hypothetical protein